MVLEINVRINENAVVTGLNRKANEIPKYMARFRQDILDMAHRWVQLESPRKTGVLRKGIKKEQKGDVGVVFADKNEVKYIYWVIDGTRPHSITPKSKKALMWKGATYPVKSVKHPGTKSNPFFDRAYPKISADIDRRVQALEKWLTEI